MRNEYLLIVVEALLLVLCVANRGYLFDAQLQHEANYQSVHADREPASLTARLDGIKR